MINQIILAWLDILWGAKVHPVRLARILDLLVVARQSNEIRVEFCQVFLEHLGVVARGVAGDHDGEENVAAFGDNFVVHEGHFVELVRADVGAVGEAKVDLQLHCQCDCPWAERGRCHTREYLPSMSSLLNGWPLWSMRWNGPPTLGFPIPFVCSAIRFRAMRSFSYVK